MSANETQVGGSHYKKQKIQHWDYVLANNIPYMEAQIIKYVSRHRDKNGVQDLEKAKHFLEKLIEVEKGKVSYQSSAAWPHTEKHLTCVAGCRRQDDHDPTVLGPQGCVVS